MPKPFLSSRSAVGGRHRWGGSPSLLALLAAILTAGCATLGPDFESPQPELEQAWADIDQEMIDDQPAEHPEWWTVFNDPVMTTLVETARSQNLTLRSAGLRILQAQVRLGIATGRRYPQVQQLTGSAGQVQISENASDNVPLLEDNFALYGLGFNLSWEVDFWGRFSRTIESSAAQLQSSIADYDAVMVALTAEVAQAYVLLRTLERRIELAESNVVTQERALEIADVKFRNGAVTELDVQQARTVLNKTQALIPLLQTSLEEARNALSVLLGVQPQQLVELINEAAPIPTPPAYVAVGMPQDLIRRRPDVRAQEWVLASQSAQIGVAITELYPHFFLGGSIGTSTTDISDKSIGDLFESASRSATGFGGFSWNILNYGRLKNNVRFQDARFQQLLVDYEQLMLTAQSEVNNSISAYLGSHMRAEFLVESVAAAERSVELSMIQYREGGIDFDRVLAALTQQLEQQDALTETNGTIAADLVNMYKVLGGGWQVDGRGVDDYLYDEDRQQLRTRTSYWDRILAE